jgi:phage shock protein A
MPVTTPIGSTKDVSEMTLEELRDQLRMSGDSKEHHSAEAELSFRQLKSQIEATDAQKQAAKAEQMAAEATIEVAKMAHLNAWMTLGMMLVAATSAVASAVSAYYAYWSAMHAH